MNRWLWTMTVAGTMSTALACAGGETVTAAPAKAGGAPAGAPVTVSSASGDFQFEKAIIPPKSLEIKGINGNLKILGTTSGTAEVRGTKRANGKGDLASQRVVATEHSGGVVICTLFANQPDDDCKPGDAGHIGHRGDEGKDDGDLAIDFEVRVPAGVSLNATTMNGNIDAKDLRSSLRVHTMNGNLDVATTGRLVAKTMNGRIVAPLSSSLTVPVQLETMNGSIELRAPGDASFELSASTMSGHIQSDFPLPAPAGPPGIPESISAKIGRGGARVALKTMNGNINVKRSN
ncbi:DUF4097 domain-containing protein [Pendulispora rubella]|uniref:DUF4097 domain-containing protein n=1 Tax=Pendulispora rubella TaxID=2741070 RepID=A0ABZ2LGL7_9BACT